MATGCVAMEQQTPSDSGPWSPTPLVPVSVRQCSLKRVQVKEGCLVWVPHLSCWCMVIKEFQRTPLSV